MPLSWNETRDRLELDILRIVRDTHSRFLDIFGLVQVNMDQFFGIEVEEFPAQIAQVALWLTDHQMNQQVGEEFDQYFARLPLTTAPGIVHGNALALDWAEVVPPERLSYILGNPPFVGKKEQTRKQKAELLALFPGVKGAGVLDCVTGWYLKVAELMKPSPSGRGWREAPGEGSAGAERHRDAKPLSRWERGATSAPPSSPPTPSPRASSPASCGRNCGGTA